MSSFRTFVVDQLSRVVPQLRARDMFGGVGIYAGQLFFALIADDTLYFKVDDSNRPEFERLGMRPFQAYGAGREVNRRCGSQEEDEGEEGEDAMTVRGLPFALVLSVLGGQGPVGIFTAQSDVGRATGSASYDA